METNKVVAHLLDGRCLKGGLTGVFCTTGNER